MLISLLFLDMGVSRGRSLRKKKLKKPKPRRVRVSKTFKNEQGNVKSELMRMTDAVRQKFRNLKQESDSVQQYFEQSAKPLLTPLKQHLVESVKEVKKEPVDIPLTPKVERSEMAVQTEHPTTVDSSTQTDSGVAATYVQRLSSFGKDKLDHVYGVRPDGSGGLMIGNSKLSLTSANVYVQGKVFRVTPGLMELLFMQVPKSNLIDSEDIKAYKEILQLTNAHRQFYSGEKPINSNRGKKYTNVIAVIFKDDKQTTGSGLINNQTFDDVNELVSRLRILILSKNAGHSAHDEEIEYLIDVLRQNGVIA